jgi:sigma-B regulation protein RsbU (phosphoserine phosphatase)
MAMRRETFVRGEVLFKAGEPADKMFYVVRGVIRLPELNLRIPAGQIIGEMGVLSPLKQRTASAICEEDLEVYTMDRQQVVQLFRQEPALALELVQTSVKRFIDNAKSEGELIERTRSELRIAHDIQTSMLPRAFPAFANQSDFETHALMEPAKEVGGDFYDFFKVGQHKVYALVGDASGKGISAALFMAIAKALLKSEAQRGFSPHRVLSRVNHLMCPDNERCMFVTACCVLLDTQTGEVECCNAGHNPPIRLFGDGSAQFHEGPDGMALGIEPDARYSSRRFALGRGDGLFLYTDGVTEAANPEQQLFSEQRLLACVAQRSRQPLEVLLSGIRNEVAGHALHEPQSDDITMLGLRYQGAGAALQKASVKRPARAASPSRPRGRNGRSK